MFNLEKIKNIAKKAKINVTDKEAQKYAEDLNDMFSFINMINEIEFNGSQFTCLGSKEDSLRDDNITKFEDLNSSNYENYKDSFYLIERQGINF